MLLMDLQPDPASDSDDLKGALGTEESHFVEAMRSAREILGWSQGEFARRLKKAGLRNFHQTTVSRIEQGERPVRLAEAAIIARVLGQDLDSMTAPPRKQRSAARVIAASQRSHDSAIELEAAIARFVADARELNEALEDATRTMRDPSGADADAAGVMALATRLAAEHLGSVQGKRWRRVLVDEGFDRLTSLLKRGA